MKFNIEQSGGKELITTLDGVSRSQAIVANSTNRLTQLIRTERQEQRMTNFAMREGIGVISAFTGESRILNQVIGSTVNSYSGASFAMSAMNSNLAKFAVPAGVAIGAFTLINQLMDAQKQLWIDLEKAATKNVDTLKKYGMISDQEWRKILERRLAAAEMNAKDAGGGFFSNLWANLIGGTSGLYANMMTDILDKNTAVAEAKGQIKLHDEEIAKRLKQQADEAERQLKALLAIRSTIGTEIGTRSLGVNIPGQKPNAALDNLLFFGGIDKQGGDIWKKQQELEMTEGLLVNASGEDRLKLLEKRKQLQQEINDLNMTDAEVQQEALMILGNSLSQIQSAMDQFGISQTSLIGQMVSGFQRILEIVETIKAVTAAINVIGKLGIFHSGGVPVPMAHTGMMLGSNYQGHREAIVKMHSGEEIITPYDPRHRRNGGRSIGTNVNVNYNVRAIDARSFETTINTSQHRRSLVKTINRALRSNN
jgi:hypothetical protein